MKLAVRYVSLPALLICSVFLAGPVIPQQTRSSSSTLQGCSDMLQEYDYALDLIFPRAKSPASFRGIDYRIVLRYLPSFRQESQIVFTKRANGRLETKEYNLPVGDESLWTRLSKIYEAGRCPTDADIKATKVIIKSFDPTPKDIEQLVNGLFRQPITLIIDPNMQTSLNSESPRIVMEDGASYRFWLDGLQNSAFFELQGPYGGQFDSPLYDEVDRLRLAVESAR